MPRSETIQIDWADVKRQFIDCVADGKRWNQAHYRHLAELHAAPEFVDEWRGGSGAQTLEWLRNGFYAPELQAAAELVPTLAETSRVGWSDEDGDVDVGRLYGGYDDYMLYTSPDDSQPGLKVTADVFFAALVNPKVVKAYGAWVAGLISGLEQAGYDLQIGVCLPVDQLYDGSTKRSNVEVNVKRAGELSDFTEWSAIFGPTGLRHIGFTAFGVASESIGKQQTGFMSMSWKGPWTVTYDREANHLHIAVNQQHDGRTFPVEHMNAQLAECGLI